jgi:hypothetical protein
VAVNGGLGRFHGGWLLRKCDLWQSGQPECTLSFGESGVSVLGQGREHGLGRPALRFPRQKRPSDCHNSIFLSRHGPSPHSGSVFLSSYLIKLAIISAKRRRMPVCRRERDGAEPSRMIKRRASSRKERDINLGTDPLAPSKRERGASGFDLDGIPGLSWEMSITSRPKCGRGGRVQAPYNGDKARCENSLRESSSSGPLPAERGLVCCLHQPIWKELQEGVELGAHRDCNPNGEHSLHSLSIAPRCERHNLG